MTEKFPTKERPHRRLIVFARYPERGAVKTRLAREIGDDRALAAYRAMLADLWRSIGLSDDRVEIEVAWTGGETATGDDLRAAFPVHELSMQTGTDLGERLILAFAERMFFHRVSAIIIIGTDDPLIPRELIDAAFRLLESCEWVLGPAADGGYYLVGARAEAFNSRVFRGIDWGASSVCSETLHRIRELKATVAVLPMRSDIDQAEDLWRHASTWRESEVSRVVEQWRES
jgi:rSAM/selenodomain-associated transferase 1